MSKQRRGRGGIWGAGDRMTGQVLQQCGGGEDRRGQNTRRGACEIKKTRGKIPN